MSDRNHPPFEPIEVVLQPIHRAKDGPFPLARPQLALAVAVLCTFGLTACGSPPAEETGTATAISPETSLSPTDRPGPISVVEPPSNAGEIFTDIAPQAGIRFVQFNGMTGE